MSWIMGLASICISAYYALLCFYPFENEIINGIIFTLLSIAYSTLLYISSTYEERIKKRIEALEKKLSDKEEGGAEE